LGVILLIYDPYTTQRNTQKIEEGDYRLAD